MNDDELLARLRHDLDDVAGPPSTPPAPPLARPLSVPPARRPWLLVGAAAATLAILVTGLVVLTRDEPAELEVSPSASTTDPPRATDTLPVPPTPDGWVVVEWGDLRLSVPPEMSPFADPSPCTTEQLRLDCSSLGFSIQFDVDPGFIPSNDDVTVNGLGQHRNNGGCGNCDVTQSVLVRDLVLDVLFHGLTDEQAWAIADTIGVSSGWRSTNEPAPPVPDDWQTVEYLGVSVSVPADWPVRELTLDDPDPRFCVTAGDVVPAGATLGRGAVSDVGDDCVGPPAIMPPTDGVRMFELDTPLELPGYPIGETVVTGEDGGPILVRVGFGVDGTIGRTILGSITTVSSSAATTAPPAVGEPGLPVPPTPDGWQIVEWGDVRLSLPPELNPSGFDEGGTASCVVQNVQGIFDLTCGEQKVTVIPAVGAAGPDGADALDLNGLVARRTENRCPSECSPDYRDSTEFVLVDLGVVVRFTGFEAADIDAFAGTLGVSSRWRARHEAPPAVPADWATFEGDGFTFRHPPDWPETELGASDRDPDFCRVAPAVFPAVTIGVGDVGAEVDCSLTLAPPTDGVRVFRRDGGTVVADGATEAVVMEGADGTEWVVRVGFGIDGSTGRAILASITSTLPPPPPTSAPPPDDTVYETAMTVIQEGDELPQLCVFGVDESYPPQCQGVDLVGFDWASVTPEGSDGGTTWGPAYLRGTYDRSTDTMTVIEARPPTEADGLRLSTAWDTRRDRSIPCPTPPGGWPPPPGEWPGTRLYDVGVFEWYLDDTESVLIVKSPVDAAQTEASVRSLYDGPLCVAEVSFADAPELQAIADQLWQMSSRQFLDVSVTVDPADAWVTGVLVAPDPALQASFDGEFGEGTVRLTSRLVPT